MEIRRFICNLISENCYVLSSGKTHIIIDPGFQGEDELKGLYGFLGSEIPAAILLTHGHFDHVLGVAPLQSRWPSVPVYMHPADGVLLSDTSYVARLGLGGLEFNFKWQPIQDGQVLVFGDSGEQRDMERSTSSAAVSLLRIKVIATPGHTPGGVCYYCEEGSLVFTGDTLFADAIGRTDMALGDYDSEIRSIMEKIILLPGDTDVHPGHGRSSTIEQERRSNPFLEPFNEPEEKPDPHLRGIEIHG